MSTFTVRPSNAEKEAFRIRLTAASLLGIRATNGTLCDLHREDGTLLGRGVATDFSQMKDGIVQTSKVLQETYGIKLGDKIVVSRSAKQLETAGNVQLISISSTFDGKTKSQWEWFAGSLHVKHDMLALGQKLTLALPGVGSHDFEVHLEDAGLARISPETAFSIVERPASGGNQSDRVIDLQFPGLGGLEDQIQQIRDLTECLSTVSQAYGTAKQPAEGVLVYGSKGTGKTHFIESLAQASWSKVVRWAPGVKISPVQRPYLVVLDTGSKEWRSRHVEEVEALFRSIQSSPALVVAEVKHPNDVDVSLRSPLRFGTEIELPIPTAKQRLEILRSVCDDWKVDDDMLGDLAQRTHGYVGSDLFLLLRTVRKVAFLREKRSRIRDLANGLPADSQNTQDSSDAPQPIGPDIEQVLKKIRPSALQEIFLENPNVHWSDIGGQHTIKQQLINAVQRPLKHAEAMKQLGIKSTKGVLLYGPPGCSKTLLVKALATEAGVNFLAVKGAELISMYVGESERATREVFRKARAAAPCIIFFDEIDSIASRGKAGSELNVLTTLLNEIDGFEELRDVLVVAATNKPQSIDPALMRPGRFDNVVYIGVPDAETRREIFLQRFKKSKVDVGVPEAIDDLVRRTEGYTGAEIVDGICQTAGNLTLDGGRLSISLEDFHKAIERTAKGTNPAMLMEYEMWRQSRIA